MNRTKEGIIFLFLWPPFTLASNQIDDGKLEPRKRGDAMKVYVTQRSSIPFHSTSHFPFSIPRSPFSILQ